MTARHETCLETQTRPANTAPTGAHGTLHDVLGDVNWGAVGAIAAVVIIPVALTIGGWQLLQGRRARKGAEAAAERAEEAALAGTAWKLSASLHPRAGLGERPDAPGVLLYVSGANVWLHEVLLSWGWSQPPPGSWVATRASCKPITGQLPIQVYSGDKKLRMAWPGSHPDHQDQLQYEMRALCSLSRSGPTFWRDVLVNSYSWEGGL